MTEHYEPGGRSRFNGADLVERIVALETRDLVRERDMERLAAALENTNKEIREFRELIAKGKGAGWALGVILGGLFAMGGAAGWLMHKFWP